MCTSPLKIAKLSTAFEGPGASILFYVPGFIGVQAPVSTGLMVAGRPLKIAFQGGKSLLGIGFQAQGESAVQLFHLDLVAPFFGQGHEGPNANDLDAWFDGTEVVGNEVLVKFNHSHRFSGENLEQHERQSLADITAKYDISETQPLGAIMVYLLHSRSFSTEHLITALQTRSDVEYVEPNYVIHMLRAPNDPSYGSLYGMQKISAPSAWDVATGSAGVVVGVIDSGVDYTHPDLAANVWSAPNMFTVTIGGIQVNCASGTHGFSTLTYTCDPFDSNFHGTHVSGTIGAIGNNGVGVVGVNWTTSIMASQFLDAFGSGTNAGAINAIEFTVQAKMIFGSRANVRVLNNSWGNLPFSQALLDEIDRAAANDILFVAAAGNNSSNNDTTPVYPASYNASNIIAVAATDSNDQLASFSDFGAVSVHLGSWSPDSIYRSWRYVCSGGRYLDGCATRFRCCSASSVRVRSGYSAPEEHDSAKR